MSSILAPQLFSEWLANHIKPFGWQKLKQERGCGLESCLKGALRALEWWQGPSAVCCLTLGAQWQAMAGNGTGGAMQGKRLLGDRRRLGAPHRALSPICAIS